MGIKKLFRVGSHAFHVKLQTKFSPRDSESLIKLIVNKSLHERKSLDDYFRRIDGELSFH